MLQVVPGTTRDVQPTDLVAPYSIRENGPLPDPIPVSSTRKAPATNTARPKPTTAGGQPPAAISTPSGTAGSSQTKRPAKTDPNTQAPRKNHIARDSLPEVEDDDDDECDGAGIGEEDGDGDDDDEKDDELEETEESSTPGRQRRRPLPSWLQAAFTRVLTECDSRDDRNRPPLYSKRTFWSQPPASYFCLEANPTTPTSLYRPQFFVWDPQALYKQLSCPACGQSLIRYSAISRPRRVVDFDSSFWLIGYRYRCRRCHHPKPGKQSVTWRSWDRRILAALPAQLASEFPAHLSHRSGMSKPLFAWMRSCFQNGMGAKQFSDALRVQHLLRYDELHLQYLDWIVSRVVMDSWMGTKYKSFLKFDDTSDEGYNGFVPSSQWFRDMYDNFIEDHRAEFNQHMGMLTGEICAIDHSHKITKHVAKVNGERVFNGLLTVTNEFGEIRSCNLVATKAQTQFELALTRMRDSLDLYGHKQPELFYTDNMADKSFLESSFPSLRRDIKPVEKYGHLKPFVLPPDVQILVRNEVSSINAALSTIIAKVPVEEDEPDLAIGYDSEWNTIISDNGKHERGEIAVVQIAFEKRVYILQISEMVAHRHLPEKLTMLLQNPRVRKVGRMVSSDLCQLQKAVQASTTFCGALDLASYAKERHAVKNARCSLSDLCAATLHCQLRKNVSERTSAAWEHANLTTEQQHYAACDAYVPLLIYHQLSSLPVPQKLPADLIPTTPVLIYATDNTTIIATGSLSTTLPIQHFKDIRVTRLHTVVTVNTILVPGAILTSHRKQPLLSFGETPFDAVCLRSHLRSYEPDKFKLPSTTPINDNISDDTRVDGVSIETGFEVLESDEAREDPLRVDDGAGNLLRVLDVEDMSRSSTESGGIKAMQPDQESESYGRKVFSTIPNPESWSTILRSRVLKDVFHVFNMLRLSTTHGLRKEFGRALRDAIFIPDKEDRLRIAAWAAALKPPRTFEQLVASQPKWVWRHCRRIIPPPEILFPLIQRLFEVYGPLKDASTQAPLFSKDNWKIAKNILELI
ncbi:hypothetical protein CPB83DRAFT_116942 [Crepidotus variabilis]|uniref:3'-5' exonuclease n=1 Tax=Crepidotus variabilis TaxID=179855 RepID=A0A9P6JIV4_9AGAR|nr:hypothetical protein CPB83DRAFT_116942 [Crepidotus variabilis]